ncbi:MAG: FAD/NAD(P)-binding protein [Alphaproteobacteria bacterium]
MINPTSPPYRLAIIGNGSTAVNALDALINHYDKTPAVLEPLHITIFGNAPEGDCGRGFAYGKIAGGMGNLTESPADGRADYGSEKGAFTRYASQLLGTAPKDMHCSSRQLVGYFHAERFQELKKKADSLGIDIVYEQARVTNLTKDDIGYVVAGNNRLYGQFDRVVLAIGDVLSSRFNAAIAKYPDQVFASPYHAVEQVIKNSGSNTVITAFGTRSSFVDLVNGFISKGYQGKIIGVSSSGQTSWQAREDRGLYALLHMAKDEVFKTTSDILAALNLELSSAKKAGVYVPDSLLQAINPQCSGRLRWDFDLREEAANADNVTYHDVVQVINWEKLYEGLADAEEKKRFNDVLSDFALYNRVNRVVPKDYKQFINNFGDGKTQIIKSSFSQNDIQPPSDGRLTISLTNGSIISTDYVVNCAIGPAASREQAQTHELLHNLTHKNWLSPHDGSGFDVASGHAIDILGAQARPYLFTGLGLESYGRQIGAWVGSISQDTSNADALRPLPSLAPRRVTHG